MIESFFVFLDCDDEKKKKRRKANKSSKLRFEITTCARDA